MHLLIPDMFKNSLWISPPHPGDVDHLHPPLLLRHLLIWVFHPKIHLSFRHLPHHPQKCLSTTIIIKITSQMQTWTINIIMSHRITASTILTKPPHLMIAISIGWVVSALRQCFPVLFAEKLLTAHHYWSVTSEPIREKNHMWVSLSGTSLSPSPSFSYLSKQYHITDYDVERSSTDRN